MNRRTQRVSNLIRNILGELLLSKLSDPRVDPAVTSITRVEVPEDLLTARVYISVIGSDAQQRLTVQALRHAAGHIQELLARRISLRHLPALEFRTDEKFKKTLQTLVLIDQAMEEIRKKEEAKQAAGDGAAEPREESETTEENG